MFLRYLEKTITQVQEVAPCIFIAGPRQVGKSTLAIKLIPNYMLLDDISIRQAITENAQHFVEMQTKPICFDEVQKTPELLEAIKISIDKNRKNGAFLLTGSANVLDMQGVGDTLAGRIINLKLLPLSMKEQANNLVDLLAQLLKKDFTISSISVTKQLQMLLIGGYPEAIKIKSVRMRNYWFASYISTYIERDIRDVSNIRDINKFIKLFNLLAPRSGSIFNIQQLSNQIGIAQSTTDNYLGLLSMIFQVNTLKPYYSNISKRFVKMPKTYFVDTGVLAHLLGVNSIQEFNSSQYKGLLLETFVYMELYKHINYSKLSAQLYYYRTTDGKEIDFIIEHKNQIIAIEVKSSTQVDKLDFKHIIDLQNNEAKFSLGLVFYLGDKLLPFGNNIYACPLGFFF